MQRSPGALLALGQRPSVCRVHRAPCAWVMDEREFEANTASFSLQEHCVIFLTGRSERALRHFPYMPYIDFDAVLVVLGSQQPPELPDEPCVIGIIILL